MTIHCDRCNVDFPSLHGFKTHCGIKHKNDFVCRECGKDYGSKTYAEDPENFKQFVQCKHRFDIQLRTLMTKQPRKCAWDGCPFDEWYENLCEYHDLLVVFWFYELGGVKFTPAELTFTMTGQPTGATYPETADPDKETYRARYQAWAKGIGPAECDRIVVQQGGKPWKDYLKKAEP